MTQHARTTQGVAVIGMAGRFPGAKSVEEFWTNLCNGVESITRFTEAELEVHPPPDPGVTYVRARGVLQDPDLFDASFFGFTPKEAELMDPQHRIFLECAWEALEQAGIDSERYPGLIGLYAGLSMNTYLVFNLCSSREAIEHLVHNHQVGTDPILVGNDKDFLTTRVSYKLNLKGPSVTVQTACSTSLVAVATAWQSLMGYQCDTALAGGVSISFPQRRSYAYQEGAMVSSDGHCRAFDADAQGMLYGAGAGIVVLKRLEDAIADGDTIYAILAGAATNNDGSAKVSYMAPSIDGQAGAILAAQSIAGISADTISYVETHGTGTPLGDPIEVAALTQAFRATTDAKQFCAIGSVKTNVGHLESAAGVTGLIKTILSLHHQKIPPSLNFQRPNPRIDFTSSPFFVNTMLRDWSAGGSPRRAGVSSFGVGGTNAHVVLEEAPLPDLPTPSRPHQILMLSAKTATALESMTANLRSHLALKTTADLHDTAFTLQVGRHRFPHRRAVVCTSAEEAVQKITQMDRNEVLTRHLISPHASVAFMFPGQGSQYVNMGRGLYEKEKVFRAVVDECSEQLLAELGDDLRKILYPTPAAESGAAHLLTQTRITQPALFVIEYALARLWMSWGITPSAMIGHSVGEYVAACLAGVFTAADALRLVATRGRLIQSLPGGVMLAMRMPEEQVRQYLSDEVCLAAVNAPSLCVVAGPQEAIASLEKNLEQAGIGAKRLMTSHAFHSTMMDPVLERFGDIVRTVTMVPGNIPFLSNLSGDWATAAEVTDPAYWVRHLRQSVRFADSVRSLVKDPSMALLEVGPGQTLCHLVKQHPGRGNEQIVVASLRPAGSDTPNDGASIAGAIANLWLGGVEPAWSEYYAGEKRRRVPLPTYPFERKRHWVEPVPSAPQHEMHNAVVCAAEAIPPTVRGGSPVEMAMMESHTTAAETGGRRKEITDGLVSLLRDLSGLEDNILRSSSSFVEMGFDSLFLTQASQAVQKRFGIKVTFRQMIDQVKSVEILAAYLDDHMPPSSPSSVGVHGSQDTMKATPPPPDTAAPAIVQASTGTGATLLERIMSQQLQVMKEQLEMLKASPGAHVPSLSGAGPGAAPQSTSTATGQGIPAPPAVSVSTTEKEFKRFGPYKPIEKAPRGELTSRQQAHVTQLVTSYTARTQQSKSYTQRYRASLADPRVVAGFNAHWKEMVYPIVATRSHGSRLWDLDGNEYIDLLNGFGLNFFGHSPEFITDALHAQLDKGVEIGPQAQLAGEVAEMIAELTGMPRVTFCNTGSEAVMAAMRLARTVTARDTIVLFTGDYHGMFDEVLVRSTTVRGELRSVPIAPGIPQSLVDNIIVLEYGSPEALEIIRARGAELAAVLVEPVQSRRPDLQPKEFLHELRAITERSGTALIFDEVVTGFRCAPGGAQEWFGVRADMATYGKVVGGGMPIGIVAGHPRFMDALDGGMWQYGDTSVPEVGVTFVAGTFVRHPLAMAAAHAALKYLKAAGPQLQRGLTERTARFTADLTRYCEERGIPLRFPQFSAYFMIAHPHDLPHASLLWYHLRAKGVHIWEGFSCFLTLAHTDEDVTKLIQAFKDSITEMQNGGFFPASSMVDGVASSGTSLPREIRVPLTEAQKEIWISTQLGEDANCTYNESNTLHFDGALDVRALQQAFSLVVHRHDAFLSRFSPLGDYQEFVGDLPIDIPFVDLSTIAAAEREQRIAEILRHEAETPFSIVTGPMIRGQLLKCSPIHHKLVITVHHMACDGWSFGVIVEELSKVYSGLRTPPIEDLPEAMQFAEYARRLQAEGASADVLKAQEYWIGQFQGMVPVLEIPTDRPRPAVKTYHGSLATHAFDPILFKELRTAGGKTGNTLFTTLLSVFGILLEKLTGQEDMVIAIPAAGQVMVGRDDLVGHCLNLLPLRLSIKKGSLFAQVAADVKAKVLDAYEHQQLTYGTLLQHLHLERDTSRHPLVSVMFNIDRAGYDILRFGDLATEVTTNPKRFVNFDLFLNIVQGASSLDLECEYNTDLFDRATVERWLGSLENLVAGMLRAPSSVRVSELSMLSEDERKVMLEEWNRTDAPYPDVATVSALIAEQAGQHSTKVAVGCDEETLTYGTLESRATQLARWLRSRGARPGTAVAVCMSRSPEMVTALLGIMRSGAAYIPLDPDYPLERLRFTVNDAHPLLVLSETAVSASLGELSAEIVTLDTAWAEINQQPGTPLATTAGPDDLAYIIYTSGTTGRPKGVEVTHRNVVNLLWSMKREPGFMTSDVLLSVTTIAFDIAGLELFLPLISGGRVELVRREHAVDGAQLIAQLERTKATVMQATPTTWRLMLQAGWNGTTTLKILCGGEALPRDLAADLCERSSFVWNMYGPTETTIWSSIWRVQASDGPILIGKPIANTRMYVLDDDGNPVPAGVPGELYIGGDGVARGYHGLSALTAERFLRDPFTSGRMYRTGDRARWTRTGEIECLGRSDGQVKIRGFRVELGEIESVLATHPGVGHAAVLLREDDPGDRRLAAYVVRDPRNLAGVEELREHLQKVLPEYMLPGAFVFLDALPLTPNGKIDRRQLPIPEAGRAGLTQQYVAPRNVTEETLARLWGPILRLERVGIHDDLFALGADSLRIFQLSVHANQHHLPLTPRQVFQHRTIALQAASLDGSTSPGEQQSKGTIRVQVREARRVTRPSKQ